MTVVRAAGGGVPAEGADDSLTGPALVVGAGEPAGVAPWRDLEIELVDGDEIRLRAPADLLIAALLIAADAQPSSSSPERTRALADRQTTIDGRVSLLVQPSGQPGRKRKRPKKATKQQMPTAGEAVLAAVAAQTHALQRADLKVRTGDPAGVHDMRVACRRLRSIFAAFRTVLGRERTDPLREQLQWLGAQLSGARDGQVALAHLRRLAEAQAPDVVLGPVAARLQQAQVADSETGRQGADRALGDDRYTRLLDDLAEVLGDPPVTTLAAAPAAEVLTAAIRRSDERLRHAIDRARRGGSGEHLHEVRKAVKRLRYTAEVAVPVLGKRAQALVECTTTVQELLGHRQDTIVTREQCRNLGLAAFAAGENAWSYGRLHGLEEARGQRAEADFWALQPRLEKIARKAATSKRATSSRTAPR